MKTGLENYDRLLEWAYGLHNRVISTERLEIVAIYYGSLLANACNYKLYNMHTDTFENINFYGMLFMSSGEGKGYAKQVMQKPFQKILKKMPETINQLALNGIMIPEQYANKGPVDYTVGIGSSDIGMYIASLFISASQVGSLNIEIDEFGDHIGKAENIALMKELYDGFMIAKLIQGDSSSTVRRNVEGLPTNMLAYGSAMGIKQNNQKMKSFKELTQTGLYRRSYIYHEAPQKSIKKEHEYFNIDDLIESYEKMPSGTSILPGKVAIKNPINDFHVNDDAKEKLAQFQDELIDLKNKNLYDELIPLDEHAYKMTEKVAAIVAILNLDKEVEIKHMEYAIDLFKRTRLTVSGLFEHIPEFEKIYLLISNSPEPLMKTDIMKKIGLTNKEFDDNIQLVDEYAHRFNQKLSEVGSKLKRYNIKEFEINKLDKMIVSISTSFTNKPETSINFKPFTVPFFASSGSSIETLISNKNVQSFCLSHYEPSSRAENGHRKLDYFIRGQNMIAFDIDEGMSLEQAKITLSKYTYIIYTTKSHQKEKNDEVLDRFRILLPTKTMFYVSPEEHKILYENLSIALDIPSYDVQTRNVSRLWFTNPDAEIFKNEGESLDIRCCLPETQTSETAMPAISAINEDEEDKRIAGMMKWFIINTTKGNRNGNLFNLGCFIAEILGSQYVSQRLEYANNLLPEPVSGRELETIISQSEKKGK